MSKPVIIRKLKNKYPNISKRNLEKIFDLFFSKIGESLSNKTGEIIYVPKKNKIRFRASKRLKEIINN